MWWLSLAIHCVRRKFWNAMMRVSKWWLMTITFFGWLWLYVWQLFLYYTIFLCIWASGKLSTKSINLHDSLIVPIVKQLIFFCHLRTPLPIKHANIGMIHKLISRKPLFEVIIPEGNLPHTGIWGLGNYGFKIKPILGPLLWHFGQTMQSR